MRPLLSILIVAVACAVANASTVYSQPHNGSGTIIQSSWWDPDGSDYDIYSWDNFTLSSAHAITEVHWRGGFMYGGSYGGPVIKFTVAIYPSIAGGSQPDVTHAPLVKYNVTGNCNQTAAGTFGGVALYDYNYTLPAAFQAAANTKYWIYIYAWQHGIPEWGFAAGSGGNGAYFRYLTGGPYYQAPPGDLAFYLVSSDAPTYTVAASENPVGAGTIQGAGQYPANTNAALIATANAGWGFFNWTENGTQVSTNSHYNFTVTADRTLVANFVPAYTVTTSAYPTYGGTTSGGGVFNSGTSATVHAVPNAHFNFVNWTWYGMEVSTTPDYTFTVASDQPLQANFAPDALSRVFDFDNASVYSPLPIDLVVPDLAAHFSATGSGYSVQTYNTVFMQPAGFGGNFLYPSSIFASDLIIDFSAPLTSFSIMYSPQELGCDSSATMRATGYLDGTQVATHTNTAPAPGTWPTGTLTLDSTAPFNQVVVHYDARPPTCQDYGVIFLADNMRVTLANAPCPGDLNGDHLIDLSDLSALLGNYGLVGGATPAQGDMNGDHNVDLSDLAAMLALYGSACP